jgi:multiple sugar transport system permease protein
LASTRLWPFVATVDQAFGQDWDVAGVVSDLFNNPSFTSSIKTTLWFNLIINPFQVLGALALAVLLTQKLPATGVWRTLVFLPVAVPPAVAAVVWGLALRSPDGLINGMFVALGFDPQPFLISPDWALWSIIIIASWVGLGYWMVFLIAGLQDIPSDLLESASVDGASWWVTFRRITVPLLKRPLMFVLVAASVSNFLLFVQVQLLTAGGPAGSTNVLMHEIYKQAFVFGNQTIAAAEVLVLVAIMSVVVAIQVRMMGSED